MLAENVSGHGVQYERTLRHRVGDPGDRGMIPITAITFSCAAIHLPAVYNLQRHQRPVPLLQCLYGVGG